MLEPAEVGRPPPPREASIPNEHEEALRDQENRSYLTENDLFM